MNQKEFFLECARVLETEGWIQGGMSELHEEYAVPEKNCARCAGGVIECVAWRKPEFGLRADNARRDFSNHLPDFRAFHVPSQSIVDWNDDKNRTKEEVIAMFRQVAEQFGDA